MISKQHVLPDINYYEPFVGQQRIEKIKKKASHLKDATVANINATYYGGGVAEILDSLTLLMRSLGIIVEWRVVQGDEDFFSITKKMHNALQSGDINLSQRKLDIYEKNIAVNALRNPIHHDFTIVHDPQPLSLVNHYRKSGPWIWHCHIDLSHPHKGLWKYLSRHINRYDAAIFALEEYKNELNIPIRYIMPAINPFVTKNKKLDESTMKERLEHFGIPYDKPLIVQVSRFDKWKDPEGVIKAFKLARNEIDARLVLLGNFATDDPESQEVYESLLKYQNDDVIIQTEQDNALVNALQCMAEIVVQKSIKEGFGLTVSEAMWKGTPVIGGNAGGIKHQIEDGKNGFLVNSVEEAADKMVKLIKNKKLRESLGNRGQEAVKEKFLLIRLLEQYIDLLNDFRVKYILT